MAERNSFVVYLDWRDKCSDMTAEEKLSIMDSIFDYVENGSEPDFSDRYMKAIWAEIKRSLDIDGEKYDAICKRNQENGKHGGRPKKEEPNGLKEEPQKPNGLSGLGEKPNETQDNPKKPISDIRYPLSDICNPISDIQEPLSDTHIYIGEFDVLWKRYPKKCGKQNAQKDYIKARKSGVDYDTISKGLDNYLEYIRVNKTEEKFIKHGSSWFHQHGWDDDYSTPKEESILERVMRL